MSTYVYRACTCKGSSTSNMVIFEFRLILNLVMRSEIGYRLRQLCWWKYFYMFYKVKGCLPLECRGRVPRYSQTCLLEGVALISPT